MTPTTAQLALEYLEARWIDKDLVRAEAILADINASHAWDDFLGRLSKAAR